ncbi:hypothetical protein BJ742DRAFT_44433 [Cladochytrium replicatum]|nr:hypothetical protein BJ742DRAFT_44433 [Cladochytrium replicatum]
MHIGVHKLSSVASPVTLNLVLSIRKLVSLFISVHVFRNEEPWLGAFAVFVGTVVYVAGGQRRDPGENKEFFPAVGCIR